MGDGDAVHGPAEPGAAGEYVLAAPTATSNRICGASFIDKITETAPANSIDAKKDGGLHGDGQTDDTPAFNSLLKKV